jgi:hypothetical protein
MGKEVGMRKFRYILPVIVALFCVLFIFITAQRSKSQIIRMIDNAGSKGEPIVIGNPWMGNSFMVSFDHEPIRLITKSFNSAAIMLFVSDSGMITFINLMGLSDNPTTSIREILLPEIFIEDSQIINVPPEIERFGLVPLGSIYVVCDDEGYSIIELPEFKITPGLFKSEPPWLENENRLRHPSVISADGNVIASYLFSFSSTPRAVWCYNIESGDWNEIIQGIGACHVSLSPDGSIVGLDLVEANPQKIQFLKSSDSSVIHEVFHAGQVIIGERWIALLDKSTDEVILVDMQNGWVERRIAIPESQIGCYTIWIPPPGGYDEMMSIREVENNATNPQ